MRLWLGGTAVAVCFGGVLMGAPVFSRAADYFVGDGQPYSSIGNVPWESLAAGDTVLIHWRPQPYHEKWVIAGVGSASAPIIVRGVPGPGGELPIIDGENAVTPTQLDYWNENRSVVKVGGSSVPDVEIPQYIIIDGLDIRGGRPPAGFTDDSGNPGAYSNNAAAIHIERGENITIRGCILRDSGNGLFVTSSTSWVSRDVLIEANYIHSNGNAGRIYEHNVYTAAIDITFQYNRFGPLASGADGNNLKDRSAGLVVRYNWIEGGNRQLDLVDGEDSGLIRNDPKYSQTHVYGNVLIEPDAEGNRQIVHYGGDSGATGSYRQGTLYFYHNTIVSTRLDRTTLFRLSTNNEHCDARNNVFYVSAGGDTLAMLDGSGVLDLSHNWIKPGWRGSFGTLTGAINDDGTSVYGTDPGFADELAQEFEPSPGSGCLDKAGAVNPAVLGDHDIVSQYVKHQGGRTRTTQSAGADIGAFELMAAPGCGAGCENPGDGGDADISGDCRVDLTDLGIVLIGFGAGGAEHSEGDTDLDGDVDITDLGNVLARFGAVCP